MKTVIGEIVKNPVGKPAAAKATKSGAALAGVLAVVKEYFEYARFAQEQETEREKIRARRNVAVAAIKFQERLMRDYFGMVFKERAESRDRFFGLMDQACSSKDEKLLNAAVIGLGQLIQSNPLVGLEKFRQAKPGELTV